MHERTISTISAVRKAVNLVLADTELAATPVHYFEPTDLAGLPPTESEIKAKEDTDLGNRTRYAKHMCLRSASRALKASLDIANWDVDLPPRERARLLTEIAAEARAASELAADAANVLLGLSDLPVNNSIEISRVRL